MIASLERIVAPINVALVPSTRANERRAKKNEQFIDARFQIQTYVAHTSNAPAQTGKVGAP